MDGSNLFNFFPLPIMGNSITQVDAFRVLPYRLGSPNL